MSLKKYFHRFKKSRPAFFVFLVTLFLLAGGTGYVTSRSFSDETPESAASRIVAECRSRPKETCYATTLRAYSKAYGPDSAFQALSLIQRRDNDAVGCHFMAHGIGLGAYERDPENWRNHVATLPQSCSYGAIHGVIESHLNTSGARLTAATIPEICGPSPIADCNHIVGHLVLVETQGNIPEALDLCRIFTDERQLEFCATGVFMEFSTAENLIAHNLAPESWKNWPSRVAEIVALCKKQTEEPFAVACWEESVHAALEKFRYDPKTIFDYCSQAPLIKAQQNCRRHAIGIMAAAARFDLTRIQYMCALPQPNHPNFQDECYGYLTSSWMATDPTAGPKVDGFCRALPDRYQATCFRYAGRPAVHNE